MESVEQGYRTRRVTLALTQDQAAIAAGVSRKTISNFENGGRGISLGNLQRLLRSVGLELTVREASSRPTLDELSDRYRGDEIPKARQRARRKTAP